MMGAKRRKGEGREESELLETTRTKSVLSRRRRAAEKSNKEKFDVRAAGSMEELLQPRHSDPNTKMQFSASSRLCEKALSAPFQPFCQSNSLRPLPLLLLAPIIQRLRPHSRAETTDPYSRNTCSPRSVRTAASGTSQGSAGRLSSCWQV